MNAKDLQHNLMISKKDVQKLKSITNEIITDGDYFISVSEPEPRVCAEWIVQGFFCRMGQVT